MDPTRFDRLARSIDQPGSRRRLLASASAIVAGAVTHSRAAEAGECGLCETCRLCGDQCCDPATSQCVDVAPSGQGIVCLLSQPVCTGGAVPRCCPAGRVCCGTAHCCDVGQHCARANGDVCCPNGTTYLENCGCLTAGQSACPAGQVFNAVICARTACDGGREVCQNACVLRCPPDQLRNVDTCACLTPCGDACCPLGKVCSSDGGEGGAPVCCEAGDEGGAGCKSDPAVLCCKAKGDAFACVKGTHTCCPAGKNGGPTYCLKGSQACKAERWVPKKKHHH